MTNQIPSHRALGSLALIKGGKRMPKGITLTTQDTGKRYIRVTDLKDYTVNTSGVLFVPRGYEDIIARYTISATDIYISIAGTIGLVGRIPECLDGANLTENAAKICVTDPTVIPDYLMYALSSNECQAQIAQATGKNAQPKLALTRIEQLRVPFPSTVDEQRAIGSILNRIRGAIRLHGQSLATAEALKRAVLRELFTHGLRGEPQIETEIGPIPQSWDVVKLGSLGRIGNGSTPKKSISNYWVQGHFPWLTSAKVYDRVIIEADQFVTDLALKECHLPRVQPGAVLIAITGQGKTLGHCAVLEIEATTNQHIAYLATDKQKADPYFVRGYLETQYDYLRQVGSGGGSTKGALTCAFLRELPVPFPPTVEEQNQIAGVLEAIDRKIDLHRRKRVVLDDLFKALLHKLMTGEIPVADLDLSTLEASILMEAAE